MTMYLRGRCVGKYSIASPHKGGWRNENYADRRVEEAIRTYKREVEKMNEKVEKLERNYM